MGAVANPVTAVKASLSIFPYLSGNQAFATDDNTPAAPRIAVHSK
jgi:hypothetical protein